jgi:hypothetical protein
MAKLIESVSRGVPKALTEIITLGRTLKNRAADILAYYLSTAAHWGITRFQALHRLFNGDGPWIPDALTPHTTAA